MQSSALSPCVRQIPHVVMLLIAHLGTSSADLNAQIEGVIVPGLTLEEIPDTNMIYYDKLVPLIFEFKTFPGLTTGTVLNAGRSKILPRLACRSDEKPLSPTMSTTDWLFTCPIFYHITNLLTQLYSNWTDIQPNIRASTTGRNTFSTEFLTFSNADLNFDECESQLRYWRGINNRDGGLAELKVIIEKCALASYFEEQIQDFSSAIGAPYEQIRDNYVNMFFGNSSAQNPSSNGGDMLATLVALQSFLSLHFYTEVSRWREAITSCQNNLVPNSIIKSTRLDRALQDIRARITPLKYSTSITSLAKLYKLPIADCILGQNSLFVRILVPVKRDRTAYRTTKVSQPRFLYNDEICQVTSNSKSDGAFSFSTSGYLIEKISHTIILAGCDSSGGNRRNGQLCKIPDKIDAPPPDKCLTSVINSNLNGIKAYCRLDCEKLLTPNFHSTPLVELPIIHRIESNRFIITLNQISSILIRCESVGLPDQMIPPQKYGAVEVTVPCECYIMYHSDKYYSYDPCTSTTIAGVTIHHALPIQMVNSTFESYVANRLQPWGNGKARSYYGKRKITFPNVTLYINMTFKDEDIVEVDVFDSDENQYVDSVQSLYTSNPGNETTLTSMDASSPISACSDVSHGHGFLWVILIVQVIFTLILLVYFVLKIRSVEKRLALSRTTISFNNSHHQSSQLTLSEKF